MLLVRFAAAAFCVRRREHTCRSSRMSRHCFIFLSHTDDDDDAIESCCCRCDLKTTRHIRVKSVEFCSESRDYFLTSIITGLIFATSLFMRHVAVRSLFLMLCLRLTRVKLAEWRARVASFSYNVYL